MHTCISVEDQTNTEIGMTLTIQRFESKKNIVFDFLFNQMLMEARVMWLNCGEQEMRHAALF